MPERTPFERGDILGQWYPTESVVAVLAPMEGAPTVEALRQAGFGDDQMQHWTAAQVLEQIKPGQRDDNFIKDALRDIQRAMTDQDGNLNVYERAARHGMDIIAVHAQDERTQRRAHDILRTHFASNIKFYGRYAITDLASNGDLT